MRIRLSTIELSPEGVAAFSARAGKPLTRGEIRGALEGELWAFIESVADEYERRDKEPGADHEQG